MNLTFGAAAPAELAEVERLIRSAFAPYVRALGREMAPDALAWFIEAIAEGGIFVAREGHEIVGAMATHRRDDALDLTMIGVSPTHQKRGIASWLIERVEEVARRRGTRALTLNTAEMME